MFWRHGCRLSRRTPRAAADSDRCRQHRRPPSSRAERTMSVMASGCRIDWPRSACQQQEREQGARSSTRRRARGGRGAVGAAAQRRSATSGSAWIACKPTKCGTRRSPCACSSRFRASRRRRPVRRPCARPRPACRGPLAPRRAAPLSAASSAQPVVAPMIVSVIPSRSAQPSARSAKRSRHSATATRDAGQRLHDNRGAHHGRTAPRRTASRR